MSIPKTASVNVFVGWIAACSAINGDRKEPGSGNPNISNLTGHSFSSELLQKNYSLYRSATPVAAGDGRAFNESLLLPYAVFTGATDATVYRIINGFSDDSIGLDCSAKIDGPIEGRVVESSGALQGELTGAPSEARGDGTCSPYVSQTQFHIPTDHLSITLSESGSSYSVSLPLRSVALDGGWEDLPAVGTTEGLKDAVLYWTGESLLLFGRQKSDGSFAGWLHSPGEASWRKITLVGFSDFQKVDGRFVSVWTGSAMVLFAPMFGFSYNPRANSWTKINMLDAPEYGTGSFVAGFGDGQIFTWGTAGEGSFGATYSIESDKWSKVRTINSPQAEAYEEEVIWTGSEFVVWTDSGVRGSYNLRTAKWDEMKGSPVDEIFSACRSKVLWVDRKLVVLSNSSANQTSELCRGAFYDFERRAWTLRVFDNFPVDREDVSIIVVGDDLLAWGGRAKGNESKLLEDGFYYDLAADRALRIPAVPTSIAGRTQALTVWADDSLIIWGGCDKQVGGVCESHRTDGGVVKVQPP